MDLVPLACKNGQPGADLIFLLWEWGPSQNILAFFKSQHLTYISGCESNGLFQRKLFTGGCPNFSCVCDDPSAYFYGT